MKPTQSWGLILILAGMTIISNSCSGVGVPSFIIGSILFLLGSVNNRWPRAIVE